MNDATRAVVDTGTNHDLYVELIRIIPAFLWVVLGFVIFVYTYRLLKDSVLPQVKSLSAWGVTVSMMGESIQAVIEVAEKNPEWKVKVSQQDKQRVIKRVQHHARLLRGKRILWFDDRPDTLANEMAMLRQLGIHVENAEKTDTVLNLLETNHYDVMISDIARSNNQPNGIDALKAVRDAGHDIPTFFYIGSYALDRGTPPYAFGITNRPDELLHLLLDILERNFED